MTVSNTIVFRAPFGIAGNLSRASDKAVVESLAMDPAHPFPSYGVPGKLSGGFLVPITTTGDAVYGFLVRPFPTQGANASDPLGASVPPVGGEADAMVFGYVNVQCNNGVPAQGGLVYTRFQNASAGKPIGGVEATATADTYQITGAIFMGPADANGQCEIRFNV